MKLVSVTISNSKRDQIADALRSVVDWVDRCVVIDTGATDDTLDVALEVARNKLDILAGPDASKGCTEARNFALDAVHKYIGADWAVLLDTDERIDLRGVDIRNVLETTEHGLLLAMHSGGSYRKERFFRLPVQGRYVGPAHEFFECDGCSAGVIDRVVFRELSKTRAENIPKLEFIVASLTKYIALHPDESRWWYFLGDALHTLERFEEAIPAFEKCRDLESTAEESAWCCYRIAQSLMRLGEFDNAVTMCALGLARHAGIAELPGLAAMASANLGKLDQAAYWARLAIPWGLFQGHGSHVLREGFRYPPGLWEKPFEILRTVLAHLGDFDGAQEAARLFSEAKAMRESQ